MTDWTYARRDLLKGLGVGAACLPLMWSRPAKAAGLAKHFVCFASSEGYRMSDWAPATGPLTGPLPFSTAPLEAHKQDIIILPDLSNPGFTGPGGGGGHGSYGSIYWGLEPGVKGTYKEPKSKTIDQEIGHALPRPDSGRITLPLHVQLNRAPQSSPAPGSSKCFWLGRGQPINPIGDPYATYMEIFGGAPMGGAGNGGAEDPAVKRLMTQRKSILDYVGRNLEAFKARLGGEDKTAIDAHFNSVRDLERQLQSAGSPGAGNAMCGGAPGAMIDLNDGLKYPDILKAHMSLIIQALKCGITNVATVQLSDSSGNNINFAFVEGIPARGTGYKTNFRNFHDVGHNPVLNGVDHKRIVDRWMMLQLANFMTDMKAVQVEGGTLLDQSVILFGNHMQDGSNHEENKIPWVVAGKGGGYFNTGQCPPSAGKPLNGVMSDICAAMGVPSPFGPTWAGLKKA